MGTLQASKSQITEASKEDVSLRDLHVVKKVSSVSKKAFGGGKKFFKGLISKVSKPFKSNSECESL